MSPALYSEDTLVQQTTAEYLEERLGWHSVSAYNTETFGPDGTLGRTSEEEVVLTRYLRRRSIRSIRACRAKRSTTPSAPSSR